jgi:hypothetical protein
MVAGTVVAFSAGLSKIVKELNSLAIAASISADTILDFRRKTGLAADEVGKWRLAAAYERQDLGMLELGFKRLNRSIDEARQGSAEQATAFKRLGVDVTATAGALKNLDTVTMEIADAIWKLGDHTERVSILQTLMGRNATELIPVFAKGADGLRAIALEAKLLGQGFKEAQLEMGESLVEATARLQSAQGRLKNQIGAAWMPVKLVNTEILTRFIALINSRDSTSAADNLTRMGAAASMLDNALTGRFGSISGDMQKFMSAVNTEDVSLAYTNLQRLTEALALLQLASAGPVGWAKFRTEFKDWYEGITAGKDGVKATAQSAQDLGNEIAKIVNEGNLLQIAEDLKVATKEWKFDETTNALIEGERSLKDVATDVITALGTQGKAEADAAAASIKAAEQRAEAYRKFNQELREGMSEFDRKSTTYSVDVGFTFGPESERQFAEELHALAGSPKIADAKQELTDLIGNVADVRVGLIIDNDAKEKFADEVRELLNFQDVPEIGAEKFEDWHRVVVGLAESLGATQEKLDLLMTLDPDKVGWPAALKYIRRMTTEIQRAKDRAAELREMFEDVRMGVIQDFGDMGAQAVTTFLGMRDGAFRLGEFLMNVLMKALEAIIAKLIMIRILSAAIGFGSGGGLPSGVESTGMSMGASGGMFTRAAGGYDIRRGLRGNDSVPALLMPGEVVVDRSTVARLERFLTNSESGSFISPFGSAGGGQGMSIHNHFNIARPVRHSDVMDLGRSAYRASQQYVKRVVAA